MSRADRTPTRRWQAPAATAVLLLTASLSACSQGQTDTSPTPSATADQPAPVALELSALDGQTVELHEGQTLDILPGDVPVESVTADIWDTDVAEFTPGSETSSLTLNPGIVGLHTGLTSVTLSTGSDRTGTIVFQLSVIA